MRIVTVILAVTTQLADQTNESKLRNIKHRNTAPSDTVLVTVSVEGYIYMYIYNATCFGLWGQPSALDVKMTEDTQLVWGALHNKGGGKDRKTEESGKEMLHKYQYDNIHKDQWTPSKDVT
jgi:hypothetical protein